MIDDKRECRLDMRLKREESPLGELANSPDERMEEEERSSKIGPLPETELSNIEVPKLTPPPGWVAPKNSLFLHFFFKSTLLKLSQSE